MTEPRCRAFQLPAQQDSEFERAEPACNRPAPFWEDIMFRGISSDDQGCFLYGSTILRRLPRKFSECNDTRLPLDGQIASSNEAICGSVAAEVLR